MTKSIGVRYEPNKGSLREIFYVRELPGDGGADWGYVTDPGKARDLSEDEQRAFLSNLENVGGRGRIQEM